MSGFQIKLPSEKVEQVLHIRYKNWKGEISERYIHPTGSIQFSANAYHPEAQWLLKAVDVEKLDDGSFVISEHKLKTFALKDIVILGTQETIKQKYAVTFDSRDRNSIDVVTFSDIDKCKQFLLSEITELEGYVDYYDNERAIIESFNLPFKFKIGHTEISVSECTSNDSPSGLTVSELGIIR